MVTKIKLSMSHRIDQLFKNKLADHSIAPGEEAWAKIQAGATKNRLVIYWRIAAVFLLAGLFITTYYFVSNPDEISRQTLSQVEDPQAQQQGTTIQSLEENKQPPITEPNIAQTDHKSALSVPGRRKKAEQHDTGDQQVDNNNSVTESLNNPMVKEEIMDNPATLVAQSSEQEKAIVIEFSLPAIVADNTEEAVASTAPTEKTGIIRFLETAKEVKNGDAPFENSLRNIKHELLAFDFKKDKTKRN